MKILAILATCLAAPAFADCPDPWRAGQAYVATGAGLIDPQSWDMMAAGTEAAPCDAWVERGIVTGELAGFLPLAPTAVFSLDGMAPHILMVRAEAMCRPVLAVRGGDGIWYFGSTVNGRQEVTIWGTPDGPLQVWVGAADREGCAATLTLETFDR